MTDGPGKLPAGFVNSLNMETCSKMPKQLNKKRPPWVKQNRLEGCFKQETGAQVWEVMTSKGWHGEAEFHGEVEWGPEKC